MRRSKPKRFTYWQARFMTEPNKETLQQLLNSAFAGTKVRQRLWPIDEEESYRYFINHIIMRPRFFCANFLGYEKGKIGQGIEEAFDKDQIDITALPAPKAADGKEQQYLDGKLYFVCSGNHVILSQDARLKAKRLEQYLNEMFHNKRCDGFPENQQLILERSISRKVRKQIKGARKIHLSTPLKYKSQETSDQRQLIKTVPLGNAWEAVKSLVGIDLTQFETDGFIDPKNIEVTLSLLWKRKRGEKRISDQLDSLTNTFRHVDDEIDFEVETDSGKLKREELRLQHESNVEHINDVPILTDIFGKMIDWYRHLVEAGDI